MYMIQTVLILAKMLGSLLHSLLMMLVVFLTTSVVESQQVSWESAQIVDDVMSLVNN